MHGPAADADPIRLPRRPDGSLDLACGLHAGRRARSQAAWRWLHALARVLNPQRPPAPTAPAGRTPTTPAEP